MIRAGFRAATAFDLTNRRARLPLEQTSDEDAGAETGIEADYRRRLAGLRHLSARDRSHALRAAREWRQQALTALRERRAIRRHANLLRRRQKAPTLR